MALVCHIITRLVVLAFLMAALFCAYQVGPWALAMALCWIGYAVADWFSELAWDAYKSGNAIQKH